LISETANANSSAGIFAGGQGGTHEGPGLTLGKHQFRQDRFVELDEVHPLCHQLGNLIAQDTHDIFGQVFLGGVDLVCDLWNKHGTREDIWPGQRDLDGLVGMALQKSEFVYRQGLAALDPPDAGRIADRVRRDVEGLEHAFEARLVLHDVEHLQERHELYASELLGHERVEVVAPLFAVGNDVNPGLFLEA
jgi:hypothetical protein